MHTLAALIGYQGSKVLDLDNIPKVSLRIKGYILKLNGRIWVGTIEYFWKHKNNQTKQNDIAYSDLWALNLVFGLRKITPNS